jgi:uroporphyrinogen-III decarboxylase
MTEPMTGRQRMLAAHRGDPVDRAPIWLREGFPIGEPYPAVGDFTDGWMHDPVYRALFAEVEPHADAINGWGLGGWGNRFLMVTPDRIHTVDTQVSPDLIRTEGVIETPRGDLTFVNERYRNDATTWYLKPVAETVDDLAKLIEAPFSVRPSDLAPALRAYERVRAETGERGVVRTGFSSPIVCISHCMHFDAFLEMTITQRSFFHELLQELTRRALAIMDALCAGRELDTVVNIGGSEQCTPPMMAPRAFDEFVVPYDGPMVARLKEYGLLTSCHCHGKIKHALHCIRDIGFDATDPVEPPPAGDLTYAEARAIVDGRVTLIGNIEWDRLCFAQPEEIRRQVREILALGNRRLILSTSAGPISGITPQVAANYRALVESALEYGS